jgi:hypothetical protein
VTKAFAGLLVLGALVAAAFGVAMLAGSQTTHRAALRFDRNSPLAQAELRAMRASLGAASMPPCLRHAPPVEGTSITLVFRRPGAGAIGREARCLYRHGYLSEADLSDLEHRDSTKRTGLSRVVPLSLQIAPDALPLALWSALVALEVVGVAVLLSTHRTAGGTPA